MGKYAEDTQVSVDRTKVEIENTLRRYGATSFAAGWEESRAAIMFRLADRHIRMVLRLPAESEFHYTMQHRHRTPAAARAACEQAHRQRWRALLLVVKAKLESVESGIETLEEAFLPHIVLPSGQTTGEWFLPQLAEVYRHGRMPSLLGIPEPAIPLPAHPEGSD